MRGLGGFAPLPITSASASRRGGGGVAARAAGHDRAPADRAGHEDEERRQHGGPFDDAAIDAAVDALGKGKGKIELKPLGLRA